MKTQKTILIVLLAILLLIPIYASQAANFKVSPKHLRGWLIQPDGTVDYNFVETTASTGKGSLQFGPIDGTVAANKFVMFPPIADMPMAEFVAFSYDIYIDPASTVGSDHLYANVYIDQNFNGIGFFGPGPGTSGFYDCRYDYVPPSIAVGIWATAGFNLSSSYANVTNRTGTCPATLAALDAADQIRFIAVNGGQSTASDVGLMGGFDNVVITLASHTDFYDFEAKPNN